METKGYILPLSERDIFPVFMKGTCRTACRTNKIFRTRILRQISVVLDSETTFID